MMAKHYNYNLWVASIRGRSLISFPNSSLCFYLFVVAFGVTTSSWLSGLSVYISAALDCGYDTLLPGLARVIFLFWAIFTHFNVKHVFVVKLLFPFLIRNKWHFQTSGNYTKRWTRIVAIHKCFLMACLIFFDFPLMR